MLKHFCYKDVNVTFLTPELGENLVRQAPCGMPEPGNQESYLVSMFLSNTVVQRECYQVLKTFCYTDVKHTFLAPELGENLVRQAPRGMLEPRNQESDLVSMFHRNCWSNGALPGVKTFFATRV